MAAASREINRTKRMRWANWHTERLLDLRMCDLDLTIEGTILKKRIERVYAELDRRGLHFRPYFWLSDDWFTPSGMTGTAVPFYFAHPRLMMLERRQMGEVEGGTHQWCMKFLRHEVGHVLDHAYLLHRRRRWQQLFGLSSHSYPRFYRPNPYSKRHVQHLEYWYAQSHPDEDFAETFAVWLQPRALWRKRYRGWPAIRKLEYLDDLMAQIAGQKPLTRTRARIDSLSTMRMTLRDHYTRKRAKYAYEHLDSYDSDLWRLFTENKGRKRRERASAFIRRVRPDVLRLTSRGTEDYRYHLNHVFKEIIGRCRQLKLYVNGSERSTKVEFAILLTKHTMDSLYRNRRWVEM